MSAEQRVRRILVPFVHDQVGPLPAVGHARLGERLGHLGVDADGPRAQVVDELLLFGQIEGIDVVAGSGGGLVPSIGSPASSSRRRE